MPIAGAEHTNDEKAFAAIDACVATLRQFVPSKKIPAKWKSYFLKAIAPQAQKRGRKLNTRRAIEIVSALATASTPEDIEKIAQKNSVSKRTVERLAEEMRMYFTGAEPKEGLRPTIIEALGRNIGAQIQAEMEKERETSRAAELKSLMCSRGSYRRQK